MITVIDYKAGNLTSVQLAFETLGIPAEITDAPDRIRKAERIVFPGVGAAGSAMATLRRLNLVEAIRGVVNAGIPFLGICLGTQIVCSRSEEDGGVETLGLIPGPVRLFRPASRFDKVPQIGWNGMRQQRPHPLFEGIADGSEFYFVHSYYPDPSAPENVLGTTDYAGIRFASVLANRNLVATQFHPEKSGRVGLRLLENFSRWTPPQS